MLEEATGRVLIPEHGILLLQQVEQEEQEEEARLGGHDFSETAVTDTILSPSTARPSCSPCHCLCCTVKSGLLARIQDFYFYNNTGSGTKSRNIDGGGLGELIKVVTSAFPGLDMGKAGANGNVRYGFSTNVPVHTLDQIEKQKRATTPQKDFAIVTGKLTTEFSDLEKTFKMMGIPIRSGPEPVQELGISSLATFLSSTNVATV
ncbi:conserved hypothetical protein [Culex quinquefasciatus]|uniref:Uncharacterized protein n=1 Tax=Culex quinquefasciatus TaxID=7176 RepID=B0X8I6_CULQU|nr:conserved hypothetical protein [Culex quinquefasciatus]|eukprot:XP_001865967.1 conserved hypothetical protein [Culex quinquefasciatus]